MLARGLEVRSCLSSTWNGPRALNLSPLRRAVEEHAAARSVDARPGELSIRGDGWSRA